MGENALRVATRRSRLALAQVEEALAALRPLLPGASFEIVARDTPGDRDRTTPLSDASVPDDFFTRDLDRLLLDGEADLAVHSAKDLPKGMPPRLVVAALLPAGDIRDVLVLRKEWPTGQPPGRIGTSSPRRESFIRDLFPAAETHPLRGSIPERLDQLDRGDFDAAIVAACALHRLGLAHRIHQYLPYDPAPQQGRLAIVTRVDAAALRAACRRLDVRRRTGLVAIVGCPADPALLSERAHEYLACADVVLHDRLLPDEVLLMIRGKAVPVGKAGGEKSIPQSEVHRMMLEHSEQGKLVVRLQGGDPSIFGHLAEELQFLRDWDVRCDMVPTVTAAQVASAQAHAPLTHRGGGKSVTMVSGHSADSEVGDRVPSPSAGNVAVYMASQRAARVAEQLLEAGWPADTSVVAGERVGYKDQRIVYSTVRELAGLDLAVPTVILVGVKSFPPRGITLFVGTDPTHFLKHGPLLHWPLIRLVSRPLDERAVHVQSRLPPADGVIFPGRFAVRSFIEALMVEGDTRRLTGKKLLAVGPATTDELAAFGLRADLAAPSLGGMRDLARALTVDFRGSYLYPCSDAAPRDERSHFLAQYGITLEPVVFYANRAMPYCALPRVPFERVIFTSSSTVAVYFQNYPEELGAGRTWMAVGPSTLKSLEAKGLAAELLDEGDA